MQIATVFLVQHAVVRELHLSSAPTLPNVFLVDITSEEIAGVRALLAHEPAVTAPPELLPVVSSRILAIDGVDASKAKLHNIPRRMLQSMSLTWSEGLPPGVTAAQGTWWTAAQAADSQKHPLVAVNQPQAVRLGLHVGSTLTFAAEDTQFTATVAAITHSDGQHAFSRAEFVFPPAALAGLPVIWYGGVHAAPERVSELQRALYQSFPTITVINVAAALETVRQVVIEITYVIQFLSAFSIFAGVVILASSVAGTRYRRIREVVVLKTLGGNTTKNRDNFFHRVCGARPRCRCSWPGRRHRDRAGAAGAIERRVSFFRALDRRRSAGDSAPDGCHRMGCKSPHPWSEAARGPCARNRPAAPR